MLKCGLISGFWIRFASAPEPSKAAPSEPSAPTAATAPGAAAPLESGDYTDIPHSQIRKVGLITAVCVDFCSPHFIPLNATERDHCLRMRSWIVR
jgi:hypothetical protein